MQNGKKSKQVAAKRKKKSPKKKIKRDFNQRQKISKKHIQNTYKKHIHADNVHWHSQFRRVKAYTETRKA